MSRMGFSPSPVFDFCIYYVDSYMDDLPRARVFFLGIYTMRRPLDD